MVFKNYLYILATGTSFVLLFACNNKPLKENTEVEKVSIENQLNNIQTQTYDLNNTEFRYDNEVVGTDEKGNEIYGNMNIEGENGEGKLYQVKGRSEVNIIVESSKNGKIIATDTDGNKYYLKLK